MKRKRVAARIAAAVLAVGMIVTDVMPTSAAERAQIKDAAVAEQSIYGSFSGVSKVIGVNASTNAEMMSSDDRSINRSYVLPFYEIYHKKVYLPGQEQDYIDSETKLYKYGNEYYASAWDTESGVCLNRKVAWHAFVANNASEEQRQQSVPQKDQNTGLYYVNGTWYSDYFYKTMVQTDATGKEQTVGYVYYVCMEDEVVCLGAMSERADSIRELKRKAQEAYGKKLSPADKNPAYYEGNGRQFQDIQVQYAWDYNEETGEDIYTAKSAYCYKADEISYEGCYYQLSWTPVTNDTQVEKNGKFLNIGYQVKVNGQMAEFSDVAQNGNEVQSFTTVTNYLERIPRSKGEAVSYEVRAVYYTETQNAVRNPQTGQEESHIEYEIVKTGAWSEVCTYTGAKNQLEIPQVTNFRYIQNTADYARLLWDKVDVATDYKISYVYLPYQIQSAEELKNKPITYHVVTVNGDSPYYDFANRSYGTSAVVDENGTSKRVPNKYAYITVCACVNKEDGAGGQQIDGLESQMICVPLNEVSNAPAITGIKAEKQSDGTFRLVWNAIDEGANVRIYYSTDKKVFQSQEYLYDLIEAEGIDTMGTSTTSDDERVKLVDTFSLKDTLKLVKKKVKYVDCSAGSNEVSSSRFTMEPGKKYYFVAVTYDKTNRNTDRSGITPYVANVARVAGETRNVSFGYYNDVTASAVVSAKMELKLTKPSVTSAKTSIAMKFDRAAGCTGYQIYRKSSGKKYKKVTTTTAYCYTDKNLKQNTVYDYKVRAYYYNPDTKAKMYSDYIYFSAETGTANNIELKIEKKSKNSAKLSWTKVPGAKRYEIYRSNTSSTDTTFAQKNGYGDGEFALSNTKWEKVKTIKKAGTTSYTDKKLKSGETYSYRVVAYYKSGKKEKCIFASDYITFKLSAPRDVKATLKGNKVKVTWKKEVFASKYEVSYKKGNSVTGVSEQDYITATTKKNSYTIKNVKQGEYVTIRVRAYGSKKWSDYSATVSADGKELAAVKKVSAKEITETNAKGEKTTAVKVSWKKVSGAAYYEVYRSYSPSVYYNMDKKLYLAPSGECSFIAKADNADEVNPHVFYEEYKGKAGTVTGTSAVDRTRLQTGVTYYYYVCAYSHNGKLLSEGYTKPASVCYQATPSIRKVTAKKGKTIVSVNKVKGARKYVIYRSTKKNSDYKKIGTTTKTTYTDKKTRKGKTYYYKVVAIGTNGLKADFESKYSKPVKVKAK